MTTKYICIGYGLAGDSIFIFPAHVEHKTMAEHLVHEVLGFTVLSAGFVRENVTGRMVCFGESESLGIKSRPEIDTALVNRMFGR